MFRKRQYYLAKKVYLGGNGMDRKLKLIWWGILGLLLVVAFVKFLIPVKSPVNIDVTEANQGIVVYITGAVEHPGLLSLPLDARLDNALRESKPKANADLEVLNPAQRLKDGQKIIVPYKVEDTLQLTGVSVAISNPVVQSGTGKININTGGVSELDNIPGIGPVLAQRIVDFREQNGFFSSTEDIQNVSGIGAKTYENMASYITVGP